MFSCAARTSRTGKNILRFSYPARNFLKFFSSFCFERDFPLTRPCRKSYSDFGFLLSMAENLNTNPTPATPSVPTTPSAAPAAGATPSIPKPQAKKETIRISLPPKPAAKPAAAAPAANATPGTPAAAPAQAGLKMSAAPAPSKTVTAAKQPAKTTSGGSKVQLIDQILAIAVALTAIACVVTSFMLQNLGNNPGY